MSPRRTLRAAGLTAAVLAALPLADLSLCRLQGQQPVVVRAATDGWLGLLVEEQIGVDRGGPWTGITVLRVAEGGPSERAGLRPGDRVVEVNGRAATPVLFNRIASGLSPGQSMRMVVQGRSGARRPVVVTAASHPASPTGLLSREMAAEIDSKLRRLDSLRVTLSVQGDAVAGAVARPRGAGGEVRTMLLAVEDSAEVGPSPLLPWVEGLHWVGGARLTPLNEDLAVYFEVDGGLLVTEVIQGTLLPEAGVRPGDVLARVDGRRVPTLEAVREALSDRRRGEVVLSLVRHGRPLVIRLPGGGP